MIEDVWGLTLEEAEQLGEEEGNKLFTVGLTVNLITPNGEDVEIDYLKKNGTMNSCIYKYPIFQSGNYTFKATNSRGRSSEITVPVEINESKIKTFTLEVSPSETKTFEFYEGQTWEDFIGESGEVVNIEGVGFMITEYDYIRFGEGGYELILIDGEDQIGVSSTDKILENGLYSAAMWAS